jgi:hypothetical protein
MGNVPGFSKEAWENPDILKMYTEGVKWVMGLIKGSTASHPKVTKDDLVAAG